MKKIFIIYSALALCFASTYEALGQIQPRVAGLETDSVYMSLLEEEMTLRQKEDSLTKAVSSFRERLRDDAANRNLHAQNILRLEGDIFDIRNRIGKIAVRTSAIEQEFIVTNLTDTPSFPAESHVSSTVNDVAAYLTANPYFKENLSEADYKALTDAGEKETAIIGLLSSFKAKYDSLLTVAGQYEATDSSAVADSLWQSYMELKGSLRDISDFVKDELDEITDTKVFSYTLLLDKINRNDLINGLNEKSIQARDQIVQLEGAVESVPVSSYPIRKRLVLGYEQTLAQALGMNKALDSLRKAESAITSMAFDFPAIDLEERLFLDYEPITIHSPAKYNTSNPIPPLAVYERGVIYRILLGSFQRAQPVSVFRGAYPVGLLRDDKEFKYYAGGFASQEEAEAALEQMKKTGFRAPKIARWDYGNYTLLEEQQLTNNRQGQTAQLFRVDISGSEGDLSEEIKTLIRDSAPGKDIARNGDLFTVGPFTTEGDAQKLAEALRSGNDSLDIAVSPITVETVD